MPNNKIIKMSKRRTKPKRIALDASLSDQSLLMPGEQASVLKLKAINDENEKQTPNRVNTPRISDQLSSTRIWSKLSEKIDKQYELMRELNDSIGKQIIECEERILNAFELKIKTFEQQISSFNDKICALEAVADEIICFKRDLSNAMGKISHLESESEQNQQLRNEIEILKVKMRTHENSTVACDLRINGVPYTNNENLKTYFENICKVVNTPTPAIKSIFRLNNKNNKNDNISPDAVIIIRMWSPYDKNFFLKVLSSFRKNNKNFNFCLRHIGLDSNCQFFINENLTQNNYQILQAAVRLKRQKKIHSAFTIRGSVYIKKGPDDNAHRIDEYPQLSCLDSFFPNHIETVSTANHPETNYELEH